MHALLLQWQAEPAEPEPLVIETSGSTGVPKRVALSRSAMRASASATHRRLGGSGQWLLALPSSHVAGVQVIFRSVLANTEPVFLEEHDDLVAAAAVMSGPRRYLSLVPTQLTRLLTSDRDVAALRTFDTILLGGAAIDPELRKAAADAGLTIVATYGMSETCGGCVYDGVALDGVALALAADGRIRIGGPVLFDGYDGQPDLTAEVLDDGWFLTSDFGRLDEDGMLQVLGRVDDVVISGGVNVSTRAVASRLKEHGAIVAAEVVGVPDDEWGQRIVAVIAVDPSSDLDQIPLEAIRDFVGATLSRTWAPRDVVVVETIPLLSNGKVDRVKVEQIAASAQRSRPATRETRP